MAVFYALQNLDFPPCELLLHLRSLDCFAASERQEAVLELEVSS